MAASIETAISSVLRRINPPRRGQGRCSLETMGSETHASSLWWCRPFGTDWMELEKPSGTVSPGSQSVNNGLLCSARNEQASDHAQGGGDHDKARIERPAHMSPPARASLSTRAASGDHLTLEMT